MLRRDAAEHVDPVDHRRLVDHWSGDDETPAAAAGGTPENAPRDRERPSRIDAAQVHAEGLITEPERTPGSVWVDRSVDFDGAPEHRLRGRRRRREAVEDELLLSSTAMEQRIGGREELVEDREPKGGSGWVAAWSSAGTLARCRPRTVGW